MKAKSFKPFRFKQFSILQDRASMKVGTDGVLLGAWTSIESPKYILDIGTGTGLIALMFAQRSKNASITAVEIEENAAIQAKENFKNSIWNQRLTLHQQSIQDYFIQNTLLKFDLIVSNPPYFEPNTESSPRSLARSKQALDYGTLIKISKSLLSKNGILSLVIPFNHEEELISISLDYDLYPSRILHVKGNLSSTIKRSLIEFQSIKKPTNRDILIIEPEKRHEYSPEYIDLLRDFLTIF